MEEDHQNARLHIKKIKVSNFKSFDELPDVELGKFNVLIGANAAGKSNFIQIIRFLKAISQEGLANAISHQGGIEYLTNANVRSSKPLNFEIYFDVYGTRSGYSQYYVGPDVAKLIHFSSFVYEFSISFSDDSYKITRDRLKLKCDLLTVPQKNEEFPDRWKLIYHKDIEKVEVKAISKHEIILSNEQGKPVFFSDIKDTDAYNVLQQEFLSYSSILKPNELMLHFVKHYSGFSLSIDADIAVYDLDVKSVKEKLALIGKTELDEDGGNLAIILKRILRNKDDARKLLNLLKDILSFVDTIDTKKFGESLFFRVKESYNPTMFFPSLFVSDGTVNITSLLVALFFEEPSISIIEEPERHMHPYVISKIVAMMKDASKRKQIIITTHNPEVVRSADLESIYLVSRNAKGFSEVTKPSMKKEVQNFLENELGITELYVQDLLNT